MISFLKTWADDGTWTRDLFLTKEVLYHWAITARKKRAEDGAQTRDPQLGRLMLYQLSYFRNFCGQRWIRTTEGVSQQIYSLPHLATLVFALAFKQRTLFSLCFFLSLLSDSNQRPRDYKSRALANWAKEAFAGANVGCFFYFCKKKIFFLRKKCRGGLRNGILLFFILCIY